MKRIIQIAFLFLVVSCSKSNEGVCLKKAGDETEETRELGEFKYIDISNKVDLIITQDTVNNATITSGENLIPGIITEIVGDTLFIRDENRCHWARNFKVKREVRLSVKSLEWIVQRGAGNITGTNAISGIRFGAEVWDASGDITLQLNVDTSHAKVHTGPSDITFTGNARVNFMYSASSGFIDNEGLVSEEAHINNSGVSDFRVHVTDRLTVQIHLSGNVFYKGSPSLIEEYNEGTGELIEL